MFLVLSGHTKDGARTSGALLQREHAQKLPWGVMRLFGSGMSLAEQVSASGLGLWLGESLAALTTWPSIMLLAVVGGVDPALLAVPAVLAARCVFMLPVATAPNAIVFGSAMIAIPRMVRARCRLNLVAICGVALIGYALVPVVLGWRRHAEVQNDISRLQLTSNPKTPPPICSGPRMQACYHDITRNSSDYLHGRGANFLPALARGHGRP